MAWEEPVAMAVALFMAAVRATCIEDAVIFKEKEFYPQIFKVQRVSERE